MIGRTSMKRKILFVVNEADFFLSHRLPLAVEAEKDGFEVHVATMAGEGVERARALGFIHHCIPLTRSGRNPILELCSFWAIYKLFRHVRPDVIHLVTIKPVLYGGIAARLAGVPGVAVAVSGLGFVFSSSGFKAKLVRVIVMFLYRLALGKKNLQVIFQNPDDRQVLMRLGIAIAEKSVLICGSGVNLSEYTVVPEPTDKPVVVMAARLLWHKGVGEFVAAAHLLKSRGVQARFVLAGAPDPGNPVSVTQEELDVWQQEGFVEVMGFRHDIANVFADSNLVVLPSYYGEGLPKVLAEAAACGRAVVTTNAPGCRDAIESNVTGLLVPVRNAAALADAIQQLIEDQALRHQMGKAGRKFAEQKFAIEKIVAAHFEVYRKLELQVRIEHARTWRSMISERMKTLVKKQIKPIKPVIQLHSSERLKILFVVTEDWYFCSHRLALAKKAVEAGFSVAVATRVSTYGTVIEDAGLQLFPVRMSRRSMNPVRELRSLLELLRVYRAYQPNIAHHVALKPVLYGSLVAKIVRVPHVVNALAGLGYIYSSDGSLARLLRPWMRMAFRLLLNREGSKVIVQNPDDRQMLVDGQSASEDRITMIRGSGVNIRHFSPLPEPESSPIVFTLVARMLHDKGVQEFVEAAGILHQQGECLKAVLVGGPDKENPAAISEEQLFAWQDTGYVEWWGHRNDIVQVWAQSHVAVLPSWREGLPKSLLEAAACARPLIASDVPGCREIVLHGENGLLAPVRNSAKLAEAMRILLHDADLRRRMGLAGRAMVEQHFSEQYVAEQTLNLYRNMCEEV